MNAAAEVSSFGTEKLSKLMLKFSIPCVLSLLVSALYNHRRSDLYRQQRAEYARQRGHGRRFPVFHHRAGFCLVLRRRLRRISEYLSGQKDMQSADKAIGTRRHGHAADQPAADRGGIPAQSAAADAVRRFGKQPRDGD